MLASFVDGFENGGEGCFVRRQVGSEAALVADRGIEPLGMQHFLEGMEHLGAVAHRFGERRRADGKNHELLDVDAVVGMRAAVDDVHHGHRQGYIAGASQVPIQRQTVVARGRMRRRQGHGQQGIRAQIGFEIGAVGLQQAGVEPALILGVESNQRIAQRTVDVRHRLEHALAAVALRVAVAQFHRLARAGGGAGRHRGAADDAGMQHHIRFDGGISAGIDDFTSPDIDDSTHNKDSSKGCFLTATSNSLSVASSEAMRSRGHAFGPSDNAFAGSG